MNKTFNRAIRQDCFFHRWRNKGYSIFSSMKVVVKVCVIPVSYSLVMSPATAIAQADTALTATHIDLKEVVVSARLKAESYSELNRVVQIITQEEIQQSSAASLQDVLEKLVNLDIRQRGGQGVQADMTFRGGSFDQVLVLLNGVNITDPQTGHHNLNIPIDLNSIQRVEILQGPGARVYGPGAFSGAINIITRPESQSFVKVSTNAGENSLIGGNIQGTFKTSNTNTLLSVSHNQCDGYTENTDFKISNLFLHTLLTSRMGDWSFFAGYQRKGFGANSFYSPLYPNQYEKTSTLLSSLEYEKKWNQNRVLVNVYLRRHWDRFELFRSNPPSWYTTHNYHLTTVAGSKVAYQLLTEFGRTQFGSEIRDEDILSNKLGDTLSNPVKVKGVDGVYYIKGDDRLIYNLFADQVFYLGRFNISTGFNYSYCSQFKGNWSYGIDLSYKLVDEFRLYTSVNRSFRNPTFTDLYYEGPLNYGNSALKPESAVTYEGGIKYNFPIISGYMGCFHRDGKDIIDWIKTPLETKYHTINYTSLNTNGVEISANSNLKGRIPIINSISASYTRLWVEKEVGDVESYYVLDYLKHSFRLGINHKLLSKMSASWNFSWQQRDGEYFSYSMGENTTYKPFWLIDLKLTWTTTKFTIYAEATNIFDTKYIDIANVYQPSRWISMGFSYKFNW